VNPHKLVGWFRDLADRYPTALANVECFAECGEGWRDAIIPALDVCERNGIGVAQIKQKFGGLRIYTDVHNEEVAAAISKAEEAAWRTCEQCGQPGKRRGGGWLETLCDACHGAR
jgi:hypothetical protein